MDGGADLDGALWVFSPTKVVADLATGTAVSGPDTDTMTGIEALGGSELNDVLRGDDGDNILFGWAGKDELYGEGGDDGLRGPAVTIEDLDFDFPPETDKVLDGGEGTDACEGENKISCELDELTPAQAEFVGNLIEAIRDIKRKNGVRVN
jgi:hypothetical protein